MTTEPDETDHLFITCPNHCLQDTPLAGDFVKGFHLRHFHVVDLPQVEVVSV